MRYFNPDKIKTELAYVLATARVSKGLTLDQASKKIGVCLNHWANWESGVNIPAKHIKKICLTLDLDANEIAVMVLQQKAEYKRLKYIATRKKES